MLNADLEQLEIKNSALKIYQKHLPEFNRDLNLLKNLGIAFKKPKGSSGGSPKKSKLIFFRLSASSNSRPFLVHIKAAIIDPDEEPAIIFGIKPA